MSFSKLDGPGMPEGPAATLYPAIEARFAGLAGSIPIGLMVGCALEPTMFSHEKGQLMALALLAIVPFLLTLVAADPKGRLVALTWAFPLGLLSILISTIRLLVFLLLPLSPYIIGLALILGLSAIGNSRHRAKDGSLALAILGLSPAASCLVVFLADYVVARILGLPWGRTGADPRPIMVFAVAVAVALLASLAVAIWKLQRRPAVPSKPETSQKRVEFDRDLT
jgi:hypothetical protein